MNSDKIGKFISKLRKEKNMTQQELGDLLGINGKSISKWERGINLPDISILKDLTNIFNISIEELLNGERKSISTSSKKDNQYFKILLLLTISVIIILFTILTINNHYQYRVFHIESNNALLNVDGYIIFNPDNEIFLINQIEYKSEIVKETDKIKIILKNNNKELFTYQSNIYQDKKSIKKILEETSINIRKASENNIINRLKLLIIFDDEQLEIPLQISEKLTNNLFK